MQDRRIEDQQWVEDGKVLEQHGGVVYRRTGGYRAKTRVVGGTLSRLIPKVRGKAARRADKRARRLAREQVA